MTVQPTRDQLRAHLRRLIAAWDGPGNPSVSTADLARLLDQLDQAEAERDHWRECREEALDAMERAEDTSAAIMADLRKERARTKAVHDVLDDLELQSPDQIGWDAAALLPVLRRALRDGSPATLCGQGPCCLGNGHAGDCRC